MSLRLPILSLIFAVWTFPAAAQEPQSRDFESLIAAKTDRSPKRRAIEYRLLQPITLNFKDVPFEEALRSISSLSGVQVIPDFRAFEEAGVSLAVPVSIAVENISMKSSLNLLLDKLMLDWVIRDDVLLITTPPKRGRFYRKTYPIGDLLARRARGIPTDSKAAEALRQVIEKCVDEDSWANSGGSGTIQYLAQEKSLLIYQSAQEHEEIVQLLASLRKLCDFDVYTDIHFVQMPPDRAKRWLEAIQRTSGDRDVGTVPFARLNQPQFTALLQSAQEVPSTRIAHLPERMMRNGQAITFDLQHTQSSQIRLKGTDLSEHPGQLPIRQGPWRSDDVVLQKEERARNIAVALKTVVVPDRRSVRLELSWRSSPQEGATSGSNLTVVVSGDHSLICPLGHWPTNESILFVVVTPHVIGRPDEAVRTAEPTPLPR
jgi:hypothetical protein